MVVEIDPVQLAITAMLAALFDDSEAEAEWRKDNSALSPREMLEKLSRECGY
jgi:hypothetical protein